MYHDAIFIYLYGVLFHRCLLLGKQLFKNEWVVAGCSGITAKWKLQNQTRQIIWSFCNFYDSQLRNCIPFRIKVDEETRNEAAQRMLACSVHCFIQTLKVA